GTEPAAAHRAGVGVGAHVDQPARRVLRQDRADDVHRGQDRRARAAGHPGHYSRAEHLGDCREFPRRKFHGPRGPGRRVRAGIWRRSRGLTLFQRLLEQRHLRGRRGAQSPAQPAARARAGRRHGDTSVRAGQRLVPECPAVAGREGRRHHAGAGHPVCHAGPRGDRRRRSDLWRQRPRGDGHCHSRQHLRVQQRIDSVRCPRVLRHGARQAVLPARGHVERARRAGRCPADSGRVGHSALSHRHVRPAAQLRDLRAAHFLCAHHDRSLHPAAHAAGCRASLPGRGLSGIAGVVRDSRRMRGDHSADCESDARAGDLGARAGAHRHPHLFPLAPRHGPSWCLTTQEIFFDETAGLRLPRDVPAGAGAAHGAHRDAPRRRAAQATVRAPIAQTAATAPSHEIAGEANLVIPDLTHEHFRGVQGHLLLVGGLGICILGMLFGLGIYSHLKRLPVHKSVREVSELIYETCKTYLIQQGKFLLLLEAFIGTVILIYFGALMHFAAIKVVIILLFSLLGIAGSYGVAWFGIRVNTFANSRTAFASLRGKPYPCYAIPLKAGMSIGMLLISVELVMMLCILLFIPGDYAGPCFIGFAIGESLGAAALRIAGGIFTKIADIGSDLMKIVFKIMEDDARNPGVIADCTGDNAGDSVGPSADGFETYGVTGVALITFILLAVKSPLVQVQLLVWIFIMRVVMILTAGGSYFINEAIAKAKYFHADKFNYEKPLTSLVWVTSFVSIAATYLVSYFVIPVVNGDPSLWWQLSTVITCGTLAGAVIPELVKVFTSTESRHVREVVTSSEEGGSSLNILSGFVAGNFSAFWLGLTMLALMAAGYWVSLGGLSDPNLMVAPAVFAFGLVAFGFLGMGPVTIAVDSYGPV